MHKKHALILLLPLLCVGSVGSTSSSGADPVPDKPQVGIMYNIHLCRGVANPYYPASGPSPSPYSPVYTPLVTFNTTAVLAGTACYGWGAPNTNEYCWGPRLEYHWLAQPQSALGFYCQADPNPTPPSGRASAATIYNLHATQMKNAGIDFVIVNFSELRDINSDDAQFEMKPAYEQMLQYWPSDGPKIVPFVVASAASTGDQLSLDYLFHTGPGRYGSRQLWYMYEGKPLVLVKLGGDSDDPSASKLASMQAPNGWSSSGLTVRRMWARYQLASQAFINSLGDFYGLWTYAEQCSPEYAGNSDRPCDPSYFANGGLREEVPLIASYGNCTLQGTSIAPGSCIASYPAYAIPNRDGKTFFSQFQMLYWWRWGASAPQPAPPKVVVISGWNGWINQRGCWNIDGAGAPNGQPGPFNCSENTPWMVPVSNHAVFVDEYSNFQHSTFEPSAQGDTDLYYKFMRAALKTLPGAAFDGHWGDFDFGLSGDVPFIASLAPARAQPYVPVVARNVAGLKYWYINLAVNGKFFGSYDPANMQTVQFGLAGDTPMIVRRQVNGVWGDHLAVCRPAQVGTPGLYWDTDNNNAGASNVQFEQNCLTQAPQ